MLHLSFLAQFFSLPFVTNLLRFIFYLFGLTPHFSYMFFPTVLSVTRWFYILYLSIHRMLWFFLFFILCLLIFFIFNCSSLVKWFVSSIFIVLVLLFLLLLNLFFTPFFLSYYSIFYTILCIISALSCFIPATVTHVFIKLNYKHSKSIHIILKWKD